MCDQLTLGQGQMLAFGSVCSPDRVVLGGAAWMRRFRSWPEQMSAVGADDSVKLMPALEESRQLLILWL